MRITIQYSAQARSVVGKASESLEFENPPPVRDVLIRLAHAHAGLRRLVLTEQGEPHPSLLLFVGEEQIEPATRRPLQEGEVLCILPPIAGG